MVPVAIIKLFFYVFTNIACTPDFFNEVMGVIKTKKDKKMDGAVFSNFFCNFRFYGCCFFHDIELKELIIIHLQAQGRLFRQLQLYRQLLSGLGLYSLLKRL